MMKKYTAVSLFQVEMSEEERKQLANIRAPFHRIPKDLALLEMHFQNIQNFQEYLSRICDHWMDHGDFTLGISSEAEHQNYPNV